MNILAIKINNNTAYKQEVEGIIEKIISIKGGKYLRMKYKDNKALNELIDAIIGRKQINK